MFLRQVALARILVSAIADVGQRDADDGNVAAQFRRRQRTRRIVEEIAALLDRGDILVEGLRVHRDEHVGAAACAEMAGFRNADFVPRRQALDIRRKYVTGRHRHPHPHDRAGEQLIGARRARAVDIGKTDYAVVNSFDRHPCPA